MKFIHILGFFDINVHYIIKRLERIINNKKLQLIACSATLPNVKEFCDLLFSRDMEIVNGIGKKGIQISLFYILLYGQINHWLLNL